MIIPWKKYIFTINDIYGSDREDGQVPKADVHFYFQQPDAINPEGRMNIYKRVKTLCIDLGLDEEQLRKEMNRTTRYQINKAGRDQLSVRYIETPTSKDIIEFSDFYNPFAEEKGIELCREDKVRGLKDCKRLIISSVYHQNGHKLASHLIIVDGRRATGLYSFSGRFTENDITSAEIGRANRYLHWQDILFFKRKNYHIYDFNGLFRDDDNDKAHQNINKFKKGFGGREEIYYNSYVAQTKKGILLLLLLRWKWRNQIELAERSVALKEKQT